jgi:bifunctional UDP-N-acetylglucosamine pyrophosphorylase/glucosamine-1-phosphate N-acetyltransferase
MSIRTVVIAAAGRGKRMREYSDQYPKPLVPINGEPFLHYVLESVRAIGCQRIIVVAGHRFAQMLEYIEQLPYPIELVNQEQAVGNAYGTAVVLRAVADRLEDEPFILYNGDMLYSSEVLAALKDDGYTHLLAAEVSNPEEYGVITTDSAGFLESIVEKPKNPDSSLVNLGIYVCQPEVVQAALAVKPSLRGEYEFTDALRVLAEQKRVKVDTVAAEWATLTASAACTTSGWQT